MNRKLPHLRKDSNPYRQKRNDNQKYEMKNQFVKSDLMNIPEHAHLRNVKVYESLVNNLKNLGLGFHLKELDIISLVSIANTIDLINEIEYNIQKHGTYQVIDTRDGGKKISEIPFVRMRTTNINLLQSQLKDLQLDPANRALLTESVLGDASMIVGEEESDEIMIDKLLGG